MKMNHLNPVKLKLVCGMFLLVTSIVGLPGLSFAQVAVIDVDPTPKTKPFDVNLAYGHQANTDLKNASGDFHRNAFRLGLNAEIAISNSLKVDNILFYTNHNYTFSGDSAFQWEDIHRVSYAPLFKYQADEQWTILGAPLIQWFGEGGAKASDSFTGGGLVGFNYRSSPDFSVGLLIGVLSQIEDDAVFLPIPTLRWKFAEQWIIRLGLNRLGPDVGLGGELVYQLNKTVEIAGGLQFQKRRFRLDKNNRVGEETQSPLYGKFTWWMFPEANLEFFASLVTNGTVRLENKNGSKITNKDYDNTAFFGGKLRFIF